MKIGERIKILRKKRGFTQKQLAEILKISISSVIKYERDERDPSLQMLIQISKALNITLYELTRDTDKEYLSSSYFLDDVEQDSERKQIEQNKKFHQLYEDVEKFLNKYGYDLGDDEGDNGTVEGYDLIAIKNELGDSVGTIPKHELVDYAEDMFNSIAKHKELWLSYILSKLEKED